MVRRFDTVVTEEPLEVRLAWPGRPARRVAVVMRTPGSDFELACGFLLTEGVLGLAESPRRVAYCTDEELTAEEAFNVVTVELASPPPREPAVRFTTVSAACGVCGTESIADVAGRDFAPIAVTGSLEAKQLLLLPDDLRQHQALFAATGAIHAAGVFSLGGDLVVAREDVGRHNAVDKVLGARTLGRASYDECSVLCVSGRVGFDIVTKAVAGRVGIVVAVGGPSSLALRLADEAGVTVVGFTRGDRFVVYTHPDRIRV